MLFLAPPPGRTCAALGYDGVRRVSEGARPLRLAWRTNPAEKAV